MNPWQLLLNIIGGILAFFYEIIPNYGISIILLTLTIGLIMFPLTLKQTRSMKAMQEIQPEVKRLQKELKGNREELNKQLMALYQERGVNPAAGCLPLILQMPVWFALFSVLRNGNGIPTDSALWSVVEPARDALEAGVPLASPVYNGVEFLGMNLLASPSFVFSNENLVTLIPYVILILIIVGAGWYQQVQTTRGRGSGEATQQMQSMQRVMKIMPLFFGFISWTLPSGLDLYFGTSNVFRIGQQALILRMDRGDGGQPAKQVPEDGPSNEDDSKPKGPSPHASKKRQKRRRK